MVLHCSFQTVTFKSKRIRLDLDCTVSSSWCEIDAVKIVRREVYPYCMYIHQFLILYSDLYTDTFLLSAVISSNPLSEDMGQLINSSTYSDVSFMVEGRKIFAHKVVLAQRSGYFDSFLSNNSIQVKNAFDKIVANDKYRHIIYFRI